MLFPHSSGVSLPKNGCVCVISAIRSPEGMLFTSEINLAFSFAKSLASGISTLGVVGLFFLNGLSFVITDFTNLPITLPNRSRGGFVLPTA